MSYKTGLIKMAIKWTPTMMILWVANIVLKGIARLTEFNFDLDARKVYVQTTLYGETEAIEVWLEDFAVINDEAPYQFVMQQARSNRPWLNNLLAHFTGKAWTIPMLPQYASHIQLIAELLQAEAREPETVLDAAPD